MCFTSGWWAPLKGGSERIRQLEGLGLKATRAFVRREDRGRERYVKKYFFKDIE